MKSLACARLSIADLALFAACLIYPVLVAAGGVRDALVYLSFITLPPSLLVILGASFFGVPPVPLPLPPWSLCLAAVSLFISSGDVYATDQGICATQF